MNTTVTLMRDVLPGFFELDESGTVRYSRSPATLVDGGASMIGENFFELAAFRNGDELKRLFRRFVESREAADSFPFDFLLENSVLHARVTLTRAFQTEMFPPESIVMISIRESEK